eukprot:7181341-Pyramimonas_sp.AAC.1
MGVACAPHTFALKKPSETASMGEGGPFSNLALAPRAFASTSCNTFHRWRATLFQNGARLSAAHLRSRISQRPLGPSTRRLLNGTLAPALRTPAL